MSGPTAAELAECRAGLQKQLGVYHGYRRKRGEPDGSDPDGIVRRLTDAVEGALAEEAAEEFPAEAAELRAEAEAGKREAEGTEPEPDTDGEQQAQALIRLAEDAELFRTPRGELGATFPVGGHHESARLRSPHFKRWLVSRFYAEHHKPPQATATAGALIVLEARAQFDGREDELHVRAAEHHGAVYLDTGAPDWSAIEVTPRGWAWAPTPPVRFRRPRGMRPLPEPRDGGSLELLRPFVNVGSDEDWMLLVGWLVAAAIPAGPYPPLILHGQRGSAKSTVTRLLRAVIDPNEAPTRDAPRDARDLAIAAHNARVVAFDNLSELRPWLSDGFCRLATGAGFGTRKLYEDDEEVVFWDTRPIVANGIEELAVRGDLLDRSIVLDLPPIRGRTRRTERQLDRDFEDAHPLILGALLEAVACSLRRAGEVRLRRLPRMADFAHRIEAAAPALGWPEGAFVDAYARNRDAAVDVELEASPVAVALLALVPPGGEWRGPATELLQELSAGTPPEVVRSDGWPRAPKGLHGALRRLAPALGARGVGLDLAYREPGKRRDRRIVVTRASDTLAANVSENGLEVSDTCPTGSPLPRGNGSESDMSDTSDTSHVSFSSVAYEEGRKDEGEYVEGAHNVSEASEVSDAVEGAT